MHLGRKSLAVALVVWISGRSDAQDWAVQLDPARERLRGVSVVDTRVVWASGNRGTVVRTTDGGSTWVLRPVPGSTGLDFRDIQAFDDRLAYVLSIGPGGQSRIYKTTDGGERWTEQLAIRDPKGFLDAFAFWDQENGIAVGDPIDGRFLVLITHDGGRNWKRSEPHGISAALEGEGAFAASGTCLVVQGEGNAWFGTGGAKVARVFRTSDRGRSWTVHDTTIPAGKASSGIFSLAFRDADHGVAVGGDYQQPTQAGRCFARTADGGRTWETPAGNGPRGYRSAVAFLSAGSAPALLAIGPTGSDLSRDGGSSWSPFAEAGAHAIGTDGGDAGWAVGESGLIARFRLSPRSR